MIFVTVGTQLPFDRMVRAVDDWAGAAGRRDVIAQVGPSFYEPRYIETFRFLDSEVIREKMSCATAIIAHAGMGSIITALELGKPIIVMPRRAALGEQRNDHQIATVKRLGAHGRIIVALDEMELRQRLDSIGAIAARDRISSVATPELLAALRQFVDYGTLPDLEPALPNALEIDRPALAARSQESRVTIPIPVQPAPAHVRP